MSPILIIAEHRQGVINPDTFGLLTAGIELSTALNTEAHVAVIGKNPEKLAKDINIAGIHKIHTFSTSLPYNHDIYVQVVSSLFDKIQPSSILSLHTSTGTDYCPALASILDMPLLPDAIAINYTDQVEILHEMYSSKLQAKIASPLPAIITVRAGVWPTETTSGNASIEPLNISINEESINFKVKDHEETPVGDVDISTSDLLLSVGRGIGDEANLELIFSTAEAMGATVSSSRPIVDAGWLPKDRQVGQSGTKVSPSIYLAIGISGAVQHIAGIKNSKVIISINKDPKAPIFDASDYGVVGDLFEILPALLEEFR